MSTRRNCLRSMAEQRGAYGSVKDHVTLANGHAVHYVSHGPAAAPNTLLLLHGAPGSHRDFKYLAPLLVSDSINLIALDLPGNGLTSADTAGGWNLDNTTFVAAVVEALALLVRKRPQARNFLLGHSTGGHTAIQAAALAAAGVVHGVILLNSAGFRAHNTQRPYERLQSVAKMIAESPTGRQEVIGQLRPVLKETGFPPSILDDEIAFSVLRTGTLDHRVIRDCVNELLDRKVPFFVASAADDLIVEKDICNELVAVISPQVHLFFDTGGHNIQKSRAQELATALQTWIASQQPSRL
ncbi:unnamed protein product [Aphanomyces euteiches]|uniref:AB hydrolase-1 domain-containing protein n=1 Tax=Aphanomyces euteiches TaxID=100861 RepID=A0A6G0WKD4_9STRA|nr:hypothetical protein Ae201684_014327 [Aphanomyces euteiches]KAH9068915.1 hypothetical protein Ae201684P_004613 [Aphanomyces euteiches]KAH9111688.1 hypothetical protein LEN26_013437 [Aphanomyces euteiches]KAH9116968.1 hypothetical protein AeMF1_009175 [Aphanomyces euteiches]KAH9136774.1 hypothetical protein AeRB84_018248 [Aphanomyces euteiches]